MMACLAGFLTGFVGSMPIAGPTSLLVFHRGMVARYRDGWAVSLGGGLGEGIYCAIAIYAVSTLGDNFTFFTPLAKAVSILLLLALGLYFSFIHQEAPGISPLAESSTADWRRQFCIGLGVAAFNPMLFVTWSGTIAVLYSLTGLTFHGYEGIGFAASVATGIIAWFSILLALMQRFSGRFSFPMLQRVIRSIGIVLLVVSVVSGARMIIRRPLLWDATAQFIL